MTIMTRTILLAAALALPLAAPASAQEVAVDGCPVAATQGSCAIVRAKDGKAYDISVANHKPEPGRGVRLTGVPSRMPGTCGEAMRLAQINWTYTRERCEPAPR